MAGFLRRGHRPSHRDAVARKLLAASKVDIVGSTNNAVRGSTGVEVQFVLPVVSAPFRLIFAYNPLILNTSIRVGTEPLASKEPTPRHQIHCGTQFLIPLCPEREL